MRITTYVLPALAAISSVFAGLEDVKTTKTLNINNFDSGVAGKDSLVAFFAEWCGHCKSLAPTWEKLGTDFADEEKVLIGQVDADSAENKPLGSRYGVRGYPTIKFFPADGSAPQDYQGPRTEQAFIDFINEQAGTHRTAGGLLNDLAGRIPSFDALISQFLSSTTSTRDSLLAQANEIANQFTTGTSNANSDTTKSIAAAYYLKVLDKISTNKDWVSSELTRLQKLGKKRGNLAGKQLDDLQIRQNILNAFENAKLSVGEIINDASASVDSVANQAGKSASSASSVISSVINSATGGASPSASAASAYNQAAGSASSVSGQAAASASSISGQAAATASGVYDQAAASASSVSGQAAGYYDQAAASASSVSGQVAGSASSVYNQAAASASSVSGQAASAASSISSQASSVYNAASSSGSSIYNSVVGSSVSSISNVADFATPYATASVKSAASDVYASGESILSQASASVDSATSKVAEAVETGYKKVAGEL